MQGFNYARFLFSFCLLGLVLEVYLRSRSSRRERERFYCIFFFSILFSSSSFLRCNLNEYSEARIFKVFKDRRSIVLFLFQFFILSPFCPHSFYFRPSYFLHLYAFILDCLDVSRFVFTTQSVFFSLFLHSIFSPNILSEFLHLSHPIYV